MQHLLQNHAFLRSEGTEHTACVVTSKHIATFWSGSSNSLLFTWKSTSETIFRRPRRGPETPLLYYAAPAQPASFPSHEGVGKHGVGMRPLSIYSQRLLRLKAIQPCLEYGNTTTCLMADTDWRPSMPDRLPMHACDQQLDCIGLFSTQPRAHKWTTQPQGGERVAREQG